MHFQGSPYAETKVVRCTMGASTMLFSISGRIFTNVSTVDRGDTNLRNHGMVYIPEGCAHGFLTLEDKTEVFYQMSEFYSAESARGVRWNDPAFQITWPSVPEVISERDRTYQDFQ